MTNIYTVYVCDYLREIDYMIVCKFVTTCTINAWAVFQDILSTTDTASVQKNKKLQSIWVPIDMISKIETTIEETNIRPLRSV